MKKFTRIICTVLCMVMVMSLPMVTFTDPFTVEKGATYDFEITSQSKLDPVIYLDGEGNISPVTVL